MEHPDHIGLTRREMEREMAWMLKRLPADPQELIKLVTHSVIMLMEKNNAAIAKALGREADMSASTAPHQETKA